MSGTVANWQQGAFSSPANGQAGDASVVLGNDNAVRSKHNSHDADATIHVQSSVLASRPGAGTAQRVWVTTDGKRAYIDSGTGWDELAYLSLADGGTVAGATTFSASVTVGGALSVTGVASFAQGVVATASLTSLTANSAVVDVLAGVARVYAIGANSSTKGQIQFNVADTIGATVNAGSIAASGAWTFATAVTAQVSVTTPFISLGANPASAGIVRIPNATSIVARNAANTGDIALIGLDAANIMQIAAATAITGGLTISSGGIAVNSGGLAVTGTATATAFSGPLTGAVTGNASTATTLQTPRTINGVAFDGSANITIAVSSLDANSLTGTTLHSTVVTSSLTTVGALNSGSIASGFGSINIGTQPLTAGVGSLSSLTLNDGSANGRVNQGLLTLTNTATQVIATGLSATSRGLLLISLGTNAALIAVTNGTTITLGTAYSNTQGTAGKLNVFISSGSLTVENLSGSTLAGVVTFFGAI